MIDRSGIDDDVVVASAELLEDVVERRGPGEFGGVARAGRHADDVHAGDLRCADGILELGLTPDKLALVPGVSIGLVIVSGIFVVSVTRGPFSTADGWVTLAIAILISLGLAALARRREQGKSKVGPAINRSINGQLTVVSSFSTDAAANVTSIAHVTSAGDNFTYSYTYDTAGLVTAQTANGVETDYNYDGQDQLTQAGSTGL